MLPAPSPVDQADLADYIPRAGVKDGEGNPVSLPLSREYALHEVRTRFSSKSRRQHPGDPPVAKNGSQGSTVGQAEGSEIH